MTHSMRGHRRGSPWRWPLGLGLPLIMLTGCSASDLPSIPTHTPVASPAAVAANELFSVLDSPQEPRDTYVPSTAPWAVRLDASSARWLEAHLGEGAETLSLYLVADADEFAGDGQSLSDRAQVFIAPAPEDARTDADEP